MGDPAMKTWQLRAGLVAGAVALACSITISDLGAQGWATAVPTQPAWLDGVFYRPLTVFSRGGRVTAATGVPSDDVHLIVLGPARPTRTSSGSE